MPAALIPLAVGVVSGLIKKSAAKKQQAYADSIKVPDANFADSPYAKAVLAEAQQAKNARMAGAGNAEANINTNQANTTRSIERNATNGAQALSLFGAVQGNTNDAYKNLGTQEQQWNQAQNQNLQTVQMSFADNTFQGQLRKQMLAIQQKNALGLAATQNSGQGTNDIINGVMAGANAYAGGGGWGGGDGVDTPQASWARSSPAFSNYSSAAFRSQGAQIH